MICKKCGNEMLDGLKSCPDCGALTELELIDLGGNKSKEIDIEFSVPSSASAVSKTPKKQKKTISRKTLFIGLIALLFIFAVSIFIIAAFVNSPQSDFNSVMYLKNNEFVVYGNNKPVISVPNIINEDDMRAHVSEGAKIEFTSEILKHKLFKKNKTGTIFYVLEDFKPSTQRGNLHRIDINGNKRLIANDVHNSIKISDDGECVLFLANADYQGNKGTLFVAYGNGNTQKIVSDMDKNLSVIANDGRTILYIKNYNTAVNAGELYMKHENVTEDKAEKIDSDVFRVLTADKNNKAVIYAKNYNTETQTHDLYVKEKDKERNRIIDKSKLTMPLYNEIGKIYFLGGLENEKSGLYVYDINTGEKEKIDGDVTGVADVSDDKKTILYRKVFDKTTIDYYAYTLGATPQKISGSHHPSAPFIYSNEMDVFAYVTNFDLVNYRGILNTVNYENGKLSESVKIADDIFDCQISKDGKTLLYFKDFSTTRLIADVYMYSENSSQKIAEELDPFVARMSSDGKFFAYFTDFKDESEYGDLYVIDKNKNASKIMEDVRAFKVLKDNSIIFEKGYDKEAKTFDLYLTEESGKNPNMIDKGVTRILDQVIDF